MESVLVIGVLCLAGCGDSLSPPDYKFNPSPHELYLIIVRSNRAIPKDTHALVQYKILNWEDCVATHSLSGASAPGTFVDITLKPVFKSKREIQIKIAEDKILPHDYWGLGVCHWGIELVDINAKHIDRYYTSWLVREDLGHKVRFACNYRPEVDPEIATSCWKINKFHPPEKVVKEDTTLFTITSRKD